MEILTALLVKMGDTTLGILAEDGLLNRSYRRNWLQFVGFYLLLTRLGEESFPWCFEPFSFSGLLA